MSDAIAGEQLRSFVERIEFVQTEIDEHKQDQSDIYTEAASAGFDKKVLRKLIALRKMDPSERSEQETLLEIYQRAIGEAAGEVAF